MTYRPARSAMQSGQAKTLDWLLEFVPEGGKWIDPLMGWTGSSDMNGQVQLRFDSREAAVAYAERNGIPYRVSEPSLRRHVLRLIAIPIVTVFGLELGSTLAFAVVTETIFNWPGVGKLIIDSITALDRPVMVAYLVLVAFLFVTINLVVDLSYALLDPRLRRGGAAA